MHCLFLDLASHDALLACVSDDVASSESVHARISDKDLIPMAEKVLSDAGWTYEDLTHVACIIGPGGFTSLRVAVTFANTLADQLDIPSAGIHLADLYRARSDQEDVLWLHSTKKDQLFVQGGAWKEPTLIAVDEMPKGNWMGELIEEHGAAIGCDSVPLEDVLDVLPAFLANQNYSKEMLSPWYGRGW